MKKMVVKTLVALAGVVLVVPFVAAALLVGARAMAAVGEGAAQGLLLAGLALGGVLFGVVKELGCRKAESGRRPEGLRLTSAGFTARRALLRT